MRELLDFVEASFHFVASTVGRIIFAVLFAIACFVAFLMTVIRLNLSEAPGLLMLALLDWTLIWFAGAIFTSGRAAKILFVASSVVMATIVFNRLLPGTAEGARTLTAYQDKKNKERADRAVQEVSLRFRCDSGNVKTLTFFTKDGNTGERKGALGYARDETGRIWCYEKTGFDSVSGVSVEWVTEAIVQQIASQSPPPQPIVPPQPVAPPPTTIAAAPPLPPPSLNTSDRVPQDADNGPPPRSVRVEIATRDERRGREITRGHEHPSELVSRFGQEVVVTIQEPVDMTQEACRQRCLVPSTLQNDITDSLGIVMASAGAAVVLSVDRLTEDMVRITAVSVVTYSDHPWEMASYPQAIPLAQESHVTASRTGKGAAIGAGIGAAIGAGIGAGIGAIVNGKKGARDGAVAGGVSGAAVGAATGRRWVLPPQQLTFTLRGPWRIPTELARRP